LGRSDGGAVGAVNVDDLDEKAGLDVLAEIRKVKQVKDAWVVKV
jgi:hypothetical protein